MKRMRYSEIDRKIAELEEVLSDGTVTWRDRRGKHAGTWRAFGEAVFSCLPERRGDVSREDCPLIAFNMDQLLQLPEAQQLGLGTLLNRIGFPVYERVKLPDGREMYEHRKGLVTLEGEYTNE